VGYKPYPINLLSGADGRLLYDGIRYVSRHNREGECWAVFAVRLSQHVVRVDPIAADDPGLDDTVRLLALAIEDDRSGVIQP
jgi:hypothetical protein